MFAFYSFGNSHQTNAYTQYKMRRRRWNDNISLCSSNANIIAIVLEAVIGMYMFYFGDDASDDGNIVVTTTTL